VRFGWLIARLNAVLYPASWRAVLFSRFAFHVSRFAFKSNRKVLRPKDGPEKDKVEFS
jgi:hypothetical protein